MKKNNNLVARKKLTVTPDKKSATKTRQKMPNDDRRSCGRARS